MINKTYDLKLIREKSKNSLPLFYLISAFVTGLVFAIINYSAMQTQGKYTFAPLQYAANYQRIVQYIFIVNLLFCLVFFINGFSMLGRPITTVILFTYGFLLSLILIISYKQQNDDNKLFFFLFYIFPSVLYSIGQISACVQSVFFSSDLYNNFLKNEVIKTKIRTYLIRYALILFLIFSGGVVMSIVAAVVGRFGF